jgi:two-component system response regulator NreC
MEVAAEAGNAADAITAARQTRPDVVLMDIGMAGMSSFEATRQIRKERPDTRVVFLSMYDDEDYVSECVEMGAAGYILKESPSDQLLTAIREVHRGGSFLSPRLLSRLVDDFRTGGHGVARQPRFGTLTKREREILKMLAEGKSVKEIATEFDLSVKTVEAHKFNLMRKLDIHNKAQLVQYAIQKKIIRLPELSFDN